MRGRGVRGEGCEGGGVSATSRLLNTKCKHQTPCRHDNMHSLLQGVGHVEGLVVSLKWRQYTALRQLSSTTSGMQAAITVMQGGGV